MNSFTPAQVKAIQTWTEQRDALLREIGIVTTDLGEVTKNLKASAQSLTDIQQQIAESRGRLAELATLEDRMRTSLATDIAELEVRKSRLEGEVAEKELLVKKADEQYAEKVAATQTLSGANDLISDQAAIVDKMVGSAIHTSETHIADMKVVMTEIKALSDEVIAKSEKNIETADLVIPKMTQFIIDLQRPIPVRRIPDRQVFRNMNPQSKETKE